MNALAHCVEAAWSPRRTPEAEAMALAGAAAHRRPAAVSPASVATTTRTTRRALAAMLEGACLAGRRLQNAGMGVHHGLVAAPRGAHRHRPRAPERRAPAALVRCNEPAVPEAVARIGAALGDPTTRRVPIDGCGRRSPARHAVRDRRRRGRARRRRPHGAVERNVAANPRPSGRQTSSPCCATPGERLRRSIPACQWRWARRARWSLLVMFGAGVSRRSGPRRWRRAHASPAPTAARPGHYRGW